MSDFLRLSREDHHLHALILKSLSWQETEGQILACLPPFLRARVRAVRINDAGVLVFHALDNAAASRLRMMLPTLLPQWTQIDAKIVSAQVKIRLPEAQREKVKQAHLSQTAAQQLLQTADALAQHPKLAAALRRLAARADDEQAETLG